MRRADVHRHHALPLGDRSVGAALPLQDLGHQAPVARLLRLQRLGLLDLGGRLVEQVVLHQHLGQARAAVGLRRPPSAQRLPGVDRGVLLVRLELHLAQAQDRHLVVRRQAQQALPGVERAAVLRPAPGEIRQLAQRRRVVSEARDRAIQLGARLFLRRGAELALDEIDREPWIAGRQVRERRQLGGDLVFAAQAIEQRGHAAADLHVARLPRLRVACRLERAVQIAELVAHLAQ